MINLSTAQLLSVWSELVEAYWGRNGFGGTSAEIYVYRLLPGGESVCSDMDELRATARRSLHAVLAYFVAQFPDARIEVDGRELGAWLTNHEQPHRCHVRITRSESLGAPRVTSAEIAEVKQVVEGLEAITANLAEIKAKYGT